MLFKLYIRLIRMSRKIVIFLFIKELKSKETQMTETFGMGF